MAVGRTVLDAPRSRDCRGWLGADVERDQPHPRHSRCARLRPPPNASNPAGTARAPFYTGAPTFPIIPRREGVEALSYDGRGRCLRATGAVRRPKAGRRGRRPLRAVCLLQVAAFDVRAQPAHHFVRASEAVLHPRPGGRGSPPLRCEWEGIGAEPALSAASRILSSASHAVQPLLRLFFICRFDKLLVFSADINYNRCIQKKGRRFGGCTAGIHH